MVTAGMKNALQGLSFNVVFLNFVCSLDSVNIALVFPFFFIFIDTICLMRIVQ